MGSFVRIVWRDSVLEEVFGEYRTWAVFCVLDSIVIHMDEGLTPRLLTCSERDRK